MPEDMEQLYQERLKRYVTAMRNEKPDKIPIRPFVKDEANLSGAKTLPVTAQQTTEISDDISPPQS